MAKKEDTTMSKRRTLYRLALPFALLATTVFSGDSHASVPVEEATVKVYKKVALSTVFIASAYLTREHLPPGEVTGIGSGILLDQEGLILTNSHVVYGATKITVMLHDNQRLTADLVALDPVTDLALLRVPLPKGRYTIAQLGDSDRIEIGERVLAIGHPFGLGYALTTGVISGFGRTPEAGEVFHDRIIQTSAAINPGNIGGPLVDLEGKVIGINTALLIGAQNIGFAIPINTVKEVLPELIKYGRVIRPWVGFMGKLLTEEVINLFALPLRHGVLVQGVERGSPADRAGLRSGKLKVSIEEEPWILGGDIIQEVNGMDIKTPRKFATVMNGLKVGQTIDLSIVRDGTARKLRVTLEERPRPPQFEGKPEAPPKIELRPL
jgi:S1-C subfamily serine protease